MTFVPVESVPERWKHESGDLVAYKPVRNYLEEFIRMGIKHARVDLKPYEYKNIESAYAAIRKAARHHAYPIDVCLRNYEIYLIRRDI